MNATKPTPSHPSTDQPWATNDIQLAAYILARGLATLVAIEGRPGERIFCFDRGPDAATLMSYHMSPEKKALDLFRSLKSAVLA